MFSESCIKLQFPEESITVLHDALLRINDRSDTAALLRRACTALINPQGADPVACMHAISESSGIHFYTVAMVAFVSAIPQLREVYRERGLQEQLLWDSMMDLTYKLQECKRVHNIWGTAVASWHTRFYTLQLFKLGRLEYEMINYRWETPYGEIRKADPVINIHIPSCGSLSFEAVLDSLAQAYRFYKPHFPQACIPFVCSSWLLYPPMYEAVFPEHSNLRTFYEQFDILEQKQDPLNKDFWRICDREYSDDALHALVPQTTLQRKLLSYLRSGGCMGLGKGAFLFDGHQILHI